MGVCQVADELERLRTEAAGRDYAPMVHLARTLYQAGLSPEQVLRECYGVDFPREVFVIAAANPYRLHLLSMWTNQPWQLVVPESQGGLASRADTYGRIEQGLRNVDPDLLPLLSLIRPGLDIKDDGLLLCYRLTELAAGRSTIFGVSLEAPDPSGYRPSLWSWDGSHLHEVTCRGDSLLAVLHEHHTDYLQELKDTQDRGEFDLVDPGELRGIRARIRQIETFQRKA